MRQSTRLILNTGLTYFRMAVTVGMGLYATRLAFTALGADVGIWSAALAAVAFLGVIPDGLLPASERYLGVAIGRGERAHIRAVFSTTFAVFGCLAPLAVLVAWPFGRLVAHGIENLDPAKVSTAILAYDLALLTFAFAMMLTPFKAMFTAHQALFWPIVAEFLDAVLKLMAVMFCARVAEEPLVGLAALTLAAQATSMVVMAVLCWWFYPEGRPSPALVRRDLIRELTGFSLWSVVGNLSYRVQTGVPPLLLSSGFGPWAAAAFYPANQLANYMLNISHAVTRAVQPAMANAEGRSEHAAIVKLAVSASKFCTLLPLCLLIPLVIEADVITRVWLGADKRPPDTVIFVRLVSIAFCIGCLYTGYHLAMLARGVIARYMLGALLFQSGGMAVAAVLVFGFHAPTWVVPAMSCLTTFAAVNWYVWHICRTVGLRYADWWSGVWAPVAMVAIPAGLVAASAHLLMSDTLPRVIVVTAAYGAVALPLIWAVGLSREERGHFARLGRKLPVVGRLFASAS